MQRYVTGIWPQNAIPRGYQIRIPPQFEAQRIERRRLRGSFEIDTLNVLGIDEQVNRLFTTDNVFMGQLEVAVEPEQSHACEGIQEDVETHVIFALHLVIGILPGYRFDGNLSFGLDRVPCGLRLLCTPIQGWICDGDLEAADVAMISICYTVPDRPLVGLVCLWHDLADPICTGLCCKKANGENCIVGSEESKRRSGERRWSRKEDP